MSFFQEEVYAIIRIAKFIFIIEILFYKSTNVNFFKFSLRFFIIYYLPSPLFSVTDKSDDVVCVSKLVLNDTSEISLIVLIYDLA